MARVVVTLVGHNKENLVGPAVTVGTARWGHNGVDFGKEVELAEGTYTVTVYSAEKAIHTQQAHVPRDGRFTIEIDIEH